MKDVTVLLRATIPIENLRMILAEADKNRVTNVPIDIAGTILSLKEGAEVKSWHIAPIDGNFDVWLARGTTHESARNFFELRPHDESFGGGLPWWQSKLTKQHVPISDTESYVLMRIVCTKTGARFLFSNFVELCRSVPGFIRPVTALELSGAYASKMIPGHSGAITQFDDRSIGGHNRQQGFYRREPDDHTPPADGNSMTVAFMAVMELSKIPKKM